MLVVIPICDGSRPQRRGRSWVVRDRAKGERVMSEASSGGGTRAEAERTLHRGALRTRSSARGCSMTSKGTVEQELATQLPEDV